MSTISKFGYSDNNNSVGVVGPRGPAGAKGDKGDTGEKGADAVFPLALNYADISGVSSLMGPLDANSTITINSNMDFNGSNSLYNVSSISGYDAIGQPLTITGQMQVNGSAQISQNLSVYGTLTMTKQILFDAETNIFGNGLSFRSFNPANNTNNGMRFLGSFIRAQSNYWIQLSAGVGSGVVITNNNLVCSGYYPENQSTPNVGTITLYGESVVVNPSLTVNGNIATNGKLSLLSSRSASINPSMVLYRSYGAASTNFNITNASSYVKVTNGQSAKGSKLIPIGGLVVGDLYKFTLNGIMSTSATGDISFNVYFGLTRACTLSFINTAMSFSGFIFTTTLTVTDGGNGTFNLSTGQAKIERDDFTTRMSFASAGASLNHSVAQEMDIYVKSSVNIAVGSMTIYNYTLENI